MRRKLCILLAVVMGMAIMPILAFNTKADAASNPYGYWQTFDWGGKSYTTVRCTYYAWQQAYDRTGVALPGWGNAGTWLDSARNAGYSTGTSARANSIAVWSGEGWGHVAFVTAVNGSKMTVNEGGIPKYTNGIANGRIVDSAYNSKRKDMGNLIGFIYLEGDPDPVPSKNDPIPPGSYTVPNGDYHIVTALDEANKGLNVYGNNHNDGTNIDVYSNTSDSTQVFTVTYKSDGYYSIIHKASGKSLDVQYGGTATGTNVQLYTKNGSAAQDWVIVSAGDGWYYIRSRCNGLYLDIKEGKTTNWESNVWMYTGNQSNAQKWKFVLNGGRNTVSNGNYHIVTALNTAKGLNVYGNNHADGTNIDVYSNTTDATQVFTLSYQSNGYYSIIHKASGKSLDVKNAGTTSETNVQLYKKNGTTAQDWIITPAGDGWYYIQSRRNGLYLDVKEGITTDWGSDVWVYTGNQSNAQKWKFLPVVNSVSLSRSSVSMKAGGSQSLTATVSPSNAANKSVSWSSSNTGVATVSNGRVKAIAAGTATITATTADGAKTATCQVTVTR